VNWLNTIKFTQTN